ncbi:MAG: response regulator [Clostridia bacterium]|nr:response regulator [Deltaproteobacteria bacterium]
MGKRILMVDDSTTVLSFEKLMFRGSDYELVTAGNGAEALGVARGPKRPDIILLDVVMPEMDGLECCRQLKSDDTTRSIPIIMVTTKGDPAMVTEAYAAGCDDFITKPIARVELLQKVQGHLELAAGK